MKLHPSSAHIATATPRSTFPPGSVCVERTSLHDRQPHFNLNNTYGCTQTHTVSCRCELQRRQLKGCYTQAAVIIREDGAVFVCRRVSCFHQYRQTVCIGRTSNAPQLFDRRRFAPNTPDPPPWLEYIKQLVYAVSLHPRRTLFYKHLTSAGAALCSAQPKIQGWFIFARSNKSKVDKSNGTLLTNFKQHSWFYMTRSGDEMTCSRNRKL